MKRVDVVLALITGEGVGILFTWLIKNSPFHLPLWLFPSIFPFLALFCLWIAYLIGKKFLFIYQLAKFLLIGAFFAVFDLIIFNLLISWLGISRKEILKYAIFVGISFTLVTIFKYFANKYWAFEKKEKEKVEKEFLVFFLVTTISGFLQVGIASLAFEVLNFLGFSVLLAGNFGKIIGIAFASVWNFIGYKFIVFKK